MKGIGSTGLAYLWEKIKNLFATGTAGRAQSIPFGKVDSTSTATAFTATVEGINELKNGTCVYLMNGVVTSAAASSAPKCFTLNVNNLGAKPVYYTTAAASYATTQFGVNYTMLFVYNTTRVSSGCWDIFYGYDSNTNTLGYQLRTNSSTLPAKFKTYRYRLLFTSADHAHFVAANASTSTDADAAKTPTTEKIDPFGSIVYYGYTTAINANANFGATYLWMQYTLNIGYSFNNTGAAASLTFPAPVYVKAAPQSDGSAIIDATTPYVQTLPSTEDGKIYIFLGLAYSATGVELRTEHPVYYYKDGAIRQWTNAAETITVTISPDGNDGYVADKTFAEIKSVLDSGGTVIAKDEEDGDSYYYLDNYIASEVVFTRNKWGTWGFATRYYTIDNTDTVSFIDASHNISSSVNSSSTTDIANSAAVKALHDAMPNINSISVNDMELQVDLNGNVNINVPSQVTESIVSGWGFTKNSGTVTYTEDT